jgi:hypothetical protein
MFSSDDDDESDDFACMSPGDRAENEKFGLEYEGPKLVDKDSRRLVTLMLHASTCPCRYVIKCNAAKGSGCIFFSIFRAPVGLTIFLLFLFSPRARPVQA